MAGIPDPSILLDWFSKNYAITCWRVWDVSAPLYIFEEMLKVRQYAIMCAGTAAQEAALEALRHGEADVQMMHDAYARRGRMFVEGLNRIGLPCCEPRGRPIRFKPSTNIRPRRA